MTANPTTTATVELLTAEVRTVMIGRRQVTLSTYRQLDEVAPEVVEAFGRVRDPAAMPTGGIPVVGRDRRDGVLVKSIAFPVPAGDGRPEEEDPLVHRYTVFYTPNWCEPVVFELAEVTEIRHPGTSWERREVTWPKELAMRVASREANGHRYSVKWVVASPYQEMAKRYQHNPDVPPGKVRFAPGVDVDRIVGTYAAELDDLVEQDRRYYDWKSLPLIVLAGPR
jgi:hypothetical protein